MLVRFLNPMESPISCFSKAVAVLRNIIREMQPYLEISKTLDSSENPNVISHRILKALGNLVTST